MTGKEKRSCQNDASLKRDSAFVVAALQAQLEEEFASPSLRVPESEVEPLQVLKHDGALERLLKAHIDEFRLSKNSTEGRDELVKWLSYFSIYLDLHLPPSKRNLYRVPLRYLEVALQDLDTGFVRPPFEPAPIAGRPFDGYIEVDFKVRCILAADEEYNSARVPGKKRPQILRQEADDRVLRRVKKAATARGLSMDKGTINGWRKALSKASADELLPVIYGMTKGDLEHARKAHGSKFVVDYLLGRITHRDTIV